MTQASTRIHVHYVFTTKYRLALFTPDIAAHLVRYIRRACDMLRVEILALAIEPDHVHLMAELPATVPIHLVPQRVKGSSSRFLRQDFPTLKQHRALWGARYWANTVGGGAAAVKKYIDDQGF